MAVSLGSVHVSCVLRLSIVLGRLVQLVLLAAVAVSPSALTGPKRVSVGAAHLAVILSSVVVGAGCSNSISGSPYVSSVSSAIASSQVKVSALHKEIAHWPSPGSQDSPGYLLPSPTSLPSISPSRSTSTSSPRWSTPLAAAEATQNRIAIVVLIICVWKCVGEIER